MRFLGEVLFGKKRCFLLQSQPGTPRYALEIEAATPNWNRSPEESWDATFPPACPLSGHAATLTTSWSVFHLKKFSVTSSHIIRIKKWSLPETEGFSLASAKTDFFNYVLISLVHVFIYHIVPSTSSIRELKNTM